MSARVEIRRRLRRAAELREEADALVAEAAELQLAQRTDRWVAPRPAWSDLPVEFDAILHTVRDLPRLRESWSWQVVLGDYREALERRGALVAAGA